MSDYRVFPLLALPSQRMGYRFLQLLECVFAESALTPNEREKLLEAGLRRITGISRRMCLKKCIQTGFAGRSNIIPFIHNRETTP